ncbi:MAG: hypothetical protein QGG25_15150 [Phycisphaerae bacterium]|jgi:hypothetical protein|nr:hypothetical protein [Phycisphaerae bacterium]
MPDTVAGIAQLARNITSGYDRIQDREASLRKARIDEDVIRAIGKLQAENAELRLSLATVICLLMSKRVISGDEFEELSTAIDKMDGVSDGRFDGKIGTDGTAGVGAEARQDLALRELSAALKKMGR